MCRWDEIHEPWVGDMMMMTSSWGLDRIQEDVLHAHDSDVDAVSPMHAVTMKDLYKAPVA